MRKIELLFLAILLTFTSCEKENVENDELVGKVTANIEGEEFFVSLPNLTKTQGSADIEGTLKDFNIIAVDALGRTLVIWVEHIFEGEGVYEIKDYPNSLDAVRVGITTKDNSWGGGLAEKTGELEVTSIEGNTLKGKFDLIGKSDKDDSSKKITGNFEILLNK